jgi:hypothetical protein
MARKQAPRERPRRTLRGRGVRGIAIATISVGLLVTVVLLRPRSDARETPAPDTAPASPPRSLEPPLSDTELQSAADGLLAAVNPRLAENRHFPAYALEQLTWMEQEVRGGRLTVAFLFDPERIKLPPTVLMAASHLDGQPTIFIVKPRFESFLRLHRRTAPPFTAQQTNDFAIGLIHEIYHLRNTTKNEPDPAAFFREESRAWKDVTLKVVRPLRALNQPIDREFVDVDDALRQCRDALPCPQLTRLVRLTR